MTKKEIIWREILFQATKKGEKKKIGFTQKEIAQKFGFSLSTVFNSLKPLRRADIVEGKRGFKIKDAEKLLYFWATHRDLKKDIIYETRTLKNIREAEGEMPESVIFGAYSAFSKKYKDIPADYDKVYIYSDKIAVDEIKNRFSPYNKLLRRRAAEYSRRWREKFDSAEWYLSPPQAAGYYRRNKDYVNLIVLEADPWLSDFGGATPDVQTFVDVWNLPEWYGKDFLASLREKIFN